jgi:hypothetical protein
MPSVYAWSHAACDLNRSGVTGNFIPEKGPAATSTRIFVPLTIGLNREWPGARLKKRRVCDLSGTLPIEPLEPSRWRLRGMRDIGYGD